MADLLCCLTVCTVKSCLIDFKVANAAFNAARENKILENFRIYSIENTN